MSLNDVLISELRDLYSAEVQLIKAMPKMARKTKTPALKAAFTEHLQQTQGQVERLKEVFGHIGKKATGQVCRGMQGLIEEAQELLTEEMEPELKDLAISGAALRIEHYEVAGYTTAILIAKQLKLAEIVALLTETLEEEKSTAKLILAQAKPMLKAAASVE